MTDPLFAAGDSLFVEAVDADILAEATLLDALAAGLDAFFFVVFVAILISIKLYKPVDNGSLYIQFLNLR